MLTYKPGLSFDEICDFRQRICLAVIDKMIADGPSKVKSIVENYNEMEERWKRYDERHGFSHQAFLKMNFYGDFKDILNFFVDKVITTTDSTSLIVEGGAGIGEINE
jgi:hypothetical protein